MTPKIFFARTIKQILWIALLQKSSIWLNLRFFMSHQSTSKCFHFGLWPSLIGHSIPFCLQVIIQKWRNIQKDGLILWKQNMQSKCSVICTCISNQTISFNAWIFKKRKRFCWLHGLSKTNLGNHFPVDSCSPCCIWSSLFNSLKKKSGRVMLSTNTSLDNPSFNKCGHGDIQDMKYWELVCSEPFFLVDIINIQSTCIWPGPK